MQKARDKKITRFLWNLMQIEGWKIHPPSGLIYWSVSTMRLSCEPPSPYETETELLLTMS